MKIKKENYPFPGFGKSLREARQSKNLSQKDLANLVGVKNGLISIWESEGNVPSNKNMETLKSLLNIDIPLIKCKVCPTLFCPNSTNQLYCSEKCRHGVYRCVVCHKVFLKNKGNTGLYCSSECFYNSGDFKKIDYKKCSKCGIEKPSTDFPHSGGSGETSYWCRDCYNATYSIKRDITRNECMVNAVADFPKKLREERVKRELTQKQLGDVVGVDLTQIRRWEKAQSLPRQSVLKKVFEYFGWELPLGARINKNGNLPLGIAQCAECNKDFPVYKKGTIFCSKKCAGKGERGEKNHAWGGGKSISNGYVKIKKIDHPHADDRGYVAEHHLVVEQREGRLLEPHERVHHKDGNRSNNHPDNLELWKVKSKDPPGVRQSDYHCAGCICCRNVDFVDGLGI